MKVLFFPIFHYPQHLETELEIILNHIRAGHEVYVVVCNERLVSCINNPAHKKYLCAICKKRIEIGLELVRVSREKIVCLPDNLDNIYSDSIPEEFLSIDELKAFIHDGVDFGMAAASTLISRYNKDHKLDTKKYKKEINLELLASFYVYYSFIHIIEDIRPDIFICFNGRYSTMRPVIRLCEKKKIRYFTHERGANPRKYSMYENSLPHSIELMNQDMNKLWDAADREVRNRIAERWFVERRNGIEQGWYSFTKGQKKGLLPAGMDRTNKNIIIYNSTIEEYAAIQGWENPLYEDEVEGLRRIIESFEEDDKYMFYLRMHPNLKNLRNSQVEQTYSIAERYKNFEIIGPNSPINTYDLLDLADVVITFSSTIGVEACFWGKPCILAGRAIYEGLDCCYKPSSHKELIGLLKENLQPKNRENALKYGFWESERGIPFKYFKPIGFRGGKFLGKRVYPGIISRFFLKLKTGERLISKSLVTRIKAKFIKKRSTNSDIKK